MAWGTPPLALPSGLLLKGLLWPFHCDMSFAGGSGGHLCSTGTPPLSTIPNTTTRAIPLRGQMMTYWLLRLSVSIRWPLSCHTVCSPCPSHSASPATLPAGPWKYQAHFRAFLHLLFPLSRMLFLGSFLILFLQCPAQMPSFLTSLRKWHPLPFAYYVSSSLWVCFSNLELIDWYTVFLLVILSAFLPLLHLYHLLNIRAGSKSVLSLALFPAPKQ